MKTVISKSFAIVLRKSSAKGRILKTISSAIFSSSSLEGSRPFSLMNFCYSSLKYACYYALVSNLCLYCTCEWISVSSRSSMRVYFLVEGGRVALAPLIAPVSKWWSSWSTFSISISGSCTSIQSAASSISCFVCWPEDSLRASKGRLPRPKSEWD